MTHTCSSRAPTARSAASTTWTAARLLGIRGCPQYRLVELEMLARGVAPESISRFDNNAIIQALAAAGEGVAIVPELVIDADDPRIAIHPLAELPARRLIAVWHRERTLSDAAREFVEATAEASPRSSS